MTDDDPPTPNWTRDRPADASDDESDGGDDSGPPERTTPGERADAPLGDLATAVRNRESEPDDGLDGLFEERDVTAIDTDAVWERLEEDDGSPTEATGAAEERVVEKASYCETCPYFSAPPDVHCTSEGTSILELVDVDHFRVVNCPKVRETDRLEGL